MNELTEWFPPGTAPARPGVYETRSENPQFRMYPSFQHWNGKYWGFFCRTARSAGSPSNAKMESTRSAPEWRGLAADPKAHL